MKPKLIIWIGMTFVVLTMILLLRNRGSQTATTATEAEQKPLAREQSAASSGSPSTIVSPKSPMASQQSGSFPPDKRDRWKELREDIERGNKPINFWAKVVDQDDQPLPGVRLTLRVRSWKLPAIPAQSESVDFREHHLVSAASGLVSLLGERGDSATILKVERDGYVMSEASRRRLLPGPISKGMFSHTSADNPALIRMWRKLAAERLVKTEKGISVPCNGTPVFLDLVTGRFGTNPAPCDMVLTLQREPQDLLRGQIKQCNWSLDIQMSDGGLQTNATEFPYLAPSDGYTNRLYRAYLTNEADWKRVEELDLFIHNRGGQHYGNVKLRVVGDWSEGPVIFLRYEAIINPAGSRNLEYDWKLRIEPQRSVANTPTQTAIPPDFTRAVSPSPIPRIVPQPPPGFHALTNRANPLAPPAPPRQQ